MHGLGKPAQCPAAPLERPATSHRNGERGATLSSTGQVPRTWVAVGVAGGFVGRVDGLSVLRSLTGQALFMQRKKKTENVSEKIHFSLISKSFIGGLQFSQTGYRVCAATTIRAQ